MANKISFAPAFGSGYSQSSRPSGPFWGCGIAFKDGYPRPVGDVISNEITAGSAADMTSELDGFFSFALQSGGKVIAAVDRVRSFPLFYAIDDGAFFLGDDPYRIQEKLGGRQTDTLALAELYLTGYVTGGCTLDPRIHQIMAGEVITAEVNDLGAWSVSCKSYYRFQHHHDEFQLSFEELLSRSQQEMDKAVERMILVADGNLIAVPLSGGYDSRFILLTLKRLGYPRLAAFSYGILGNDEAAVSKRVADALGVPWHFVEYTPELWRTWLDSPEFAHYQREGEKMVSVAHIQDWPAVYELKKQGVFPKGTLFAPGHSGDFLGGKQIRPSLLKGNGWNHTNVIQEIWKRHYTNVSLKVALRELSLDKDAEKALLQKTGAHLVGFDVNTLEGANNAYDFEFWQEKLSKFVVNSVRVYEVFGYRWWLPFYDKQLVSFWERVPLQWRLGKILYDRTVENLQGEYGMETPTRKKPSIVRRFRAWISFPLLELLLWKVYGRRKMLNNYILGCQNAISQLEFMRYLGDGGNINGYLAALHHRNYSCATISKIER